jgi:toxin ParE1/3/4
VKRSVEWSSTAVDDIESQIVYIASDNLAAAQRVSTRIRATGAALGQITTGRPGRVGGTYEKLVTGLPYIIVYAITKDSGHETVSILRVIHAARDWQPEKWPS